MAPQCHIRLDSFKNHFFNGFTKLQHDEEFVDLTLAAEGHLVKVHKNMLALASPYIKEVLQSAPCPHPVIFLTQIKKETLCYILEYVYTGEVQIPTVKINSFVEAAKALHIVGLENVIPPMCSASYQSEVLKNAHKRKGRQQNRNHNVGTFPEIIAETNTAQPTVSHLPVNTSSITDVDVDNNIIQNNNTFAIPQATQNIKTNEQLHNIEVINVDDEVKEEIYNENCTNTTKEINIDLDTIVPSLQLQLDNSNNGNDTTTTDAYNDIKNAKALWSEDDTVNGMDFTSEEIENTEQNNIVSPGGKTDNENEFKSNINGNSFDLNKTNLFDFEAAISSITPVDNFSRKLQQPTYNDSFTSNMETIVNGEVLFETVAPHNNQQFSFEINASDAENDTNKQMTITINPILIEPKVNTETENTSVTHDCSNPLYTFSKRGRLMLILNRYMYNLHHLSKRKRRWRCIDYYNRGKQSCKAYVDTENEMVISRKLMHNHPFHDKKILSKGQMGNIYTTIKGASNQMEECGCEKRDVK